MVIFLGLAWYVAISKYYSKKILNRFVWVAISRDIEFNFSVDNIEYVTYDKEKIFMWEKINFHDAFILKPGEETDFWP